MKKFTRENEVKKSPIESVEVLNCRLRAITLIKKVFKFVNNSNVANLCMIFETFICFYFTCNSYYWFLEIQCYFNHRACLTLTFTRRRFDNFPKKVERRDCGGI